MADLTLIPELESIKRIDSIQDVALLSDFVYTLIPNDNRDTEFDVTQNVVELYHKYKSKINSGWCYTCALYLHMLLKEYHKDSFVYNYGLQGAQITHAVVVVTIKDHRFLIDPYFNKYYTDNNDEPIVFEKLLYLAKHQRHLIKSVYGAGLKLIKEGGTYNPVSPKEYEEKVITFFKECLNADKLMQEQVGTTNPIALIPCKIEKVRVLSKMNKDLYYEFY